MFLELIVFNIETTVRFNNSQIKEQHYSHFVNDLFILVCITVVERFINSLTDEVKSSQKAIEDEFRKLCKTVKDSKEDRFVSILCP